MTTQTFERAVTLPAPADEAFAWHERPGAFERLTPPWEPVKVLHSDGHIRDGAKVVLKLGALPLRWHALHSGYEAGRRFVDEQVKGPFARWRHSHTVEPAGAGSRLTDHIDYALPLSPVSDWVAGTPVRRKLERMFTWRHRIMTEDLKAHAAAGLAPMTVAVSGATGLVGSALSAFLSTGGHTVRPMVRREAEGGIAWPVADHLDPAALAGVDAVVHLAGETVAQRWSDLAKVRILNSRTVRTRALAEAIAAMPHKPKVLVCASAVGWYGDTGDGWVEEGAPPADDFLAQVCQAWEAACQPARDAGVRVVNLRIGVVLSPNGGALAKLLTPFKLGLGGPVGTGRQYMSWIALEDVVGAIHHALAADTLEGPVNAVAPNPVTNAEFSRTLGKVLGRPAVLPAPAFALKLAFGEMAQGTILGGQRVRPSRLEATGYRFRLPELDGALQALLGRA
ncbi:MAG: TIGR01777 family oxidoreductase [Myxococcales bacterium]|nr:TIGR01777 family oxidoreductase [Myxococcales bacterium]